MVAAAGVSFSVTHFVALKVLDRVGVMHGLFVPLGHGPLVSMSGIEMIVYVSVEICGAVKPWAGTDENAATEPLRAIVAIGGAVIGRDVVVSIRTDWRGADTHSDLGGCIGHHPEHSDC